MGDGMTSVLKILQLSMATTHRLEGGERDEADNASRIPLKSLLEPCHEV